MQFNQKLNDNVPIFYLFLSCVFLFLPYIHIYIYIFSFYIFAKQKIIDLKQSPNLVPHRERLFYAKLYEVARKYFRHSFVEKENLLLINLLIILLSIYEFLYFGYITSKQFGFFSFC